MNKRLFMLLAVSITRAMADDIDNDVPSVQRITWHNIRVRDSVSPEDLRVMTMPLWCYLVAAV